MAPDFAAVLLAIQQMAAMQQQTSHQMAAMQQQSTRMRTQMATMQGIPDEGSDDGEVNDDELMTEHSGGRSAKQRRLVLGPSGPA